VKLQRKCGRSATNTGHLSRAIEPPNASKMKNSKHPTRVNQTLLVGGDSFLQPAGNPYASRGSINAPSAIRLLMSSSGFALS
jgi:hypothetical protein